MTVTAGSWHRLAPVVQQSAGATRNMKTCHYDKDGKLTGSTESHSAIDDLAKLIMWIILAPIVIMVIFYTFVSIYGVGLLT
jgi:hypothetical protein